MLDVTFRRGIVYTRYVSGPSRYLLSADHTYLDERAGFLLGAVKKLVDRENPLEGCVCRAGLARCLHD